jgi:hypothetical protein
MKMSGREKPVIVGFRYSYPLCTIELVLEQMKSLDGFLHRILNSKIYKPSRKLRISLTADQLKALNRLSFVNGYASRIKTRLTRNEIAEVKQAWKYG